MVFPEELYTLWWNLLLEQYGVSVLLKVVQTLTSVGYRFDMSISNRFCELVQDQTQPVHSVMPPAIVWGQIVDSTQSLRSWYVLFALKTLCLKTIAQYVSCLCDTKALLSNAPIMLMESPMSHLNTSQTLHSIL